MQENRIYTWPTLDSDKQIRVPFLRSAETTKTKFLVEVSNMLRSENT